MKQLTFSYCLFMIVILGLTSCNVISRSDGGEGDIQVSVPPVEAAQSEIEPQSEVEPQGEAAPQNESEAQIQGVPVRLQPFALQIEVGIVTSVEIWADNVTNLTEVDIELRFNPAILQVQDADLNQEGTQITPGGFLSIDSPTINQADNSTGIIRYAAQQVNTPPANGNGILAFITFLGVSPGVSDLSFSNTPPSNASGQSGRITVNQSSVETPTPPIIVEPVPTATPIEIAIATPLPEATAMPVPEQNNTSSPIAPPVTDNETTATATVDPRCVQVPKGPTPDPALCNTEPPPPTIPVNGTLGYCYQVKPGQDFYAVTQEFDISGHALNVVNDLYPPNMVYAHMALFIPTQLGNGPNFYIVKAGDTLTSIANTCRIKTSMIARVNNLAAESASIEPGDVLEIPIPPYPPPAKFNYPLGPIPVIPPPIAPYSAP